MPHRIIFMQFFFSSMKFFMKQISFFIIFVKAKENHPTFNFLSVV